MHINSQADAQLIGSRVIFHGYYANIEATIIASKTEQRGSIAITEVLLQPDAGFPIWRGFGECTVIAAPVIEVLDAVEVIEASAVYYGVVVNVFGDTITVRTDEDEFIRCNPGEIRLAKAV